MSKPTAKKMSKSERRDNINGFLFALPWIIGFVCFSLIPLLTSFYYSFPSFNPVKPPEWIGLENFKYILKDPLVCKSLKNTLFMEMGIRDSSIREHGGADLQILGIGWNGHIGINQPGTPFGSDTWVSPMDEIFEARVRRETAVPDDHELGGLTLGIKTIMQSRRIILAAKGEKKAEIIRQALEGPVTEAVPASILQLHPNCEVLLDREAAGALMRKTI